MGGDDKKSCILISGQRDGCVLKAFLSISFPLFCFCAVFFERLCGFVHNASGSGVSAKRCAQLFTMPCISYESLIAVVQIKWCD